VNDDEEWRQALRGGEGANPGTDSQFPANCAGNLVSVPGLRRIATPAPKAVKHPGMTQGEANGAEIRVLGRLQLRDPSLGVPNGFGETRPSVSFPWGKP